MRNNRLLVRDSCTGTLQGTKTCIYNTDSMNNTLARLHSLLTGVRRSMGCWRLKDSIIHTILMVVFSLPVELLDKICARFVSIPYVSERTSTFFPTNSIASSHMQMYLVLVDPTGE